MFSMILKKHIPTGCNLYYLLWHLEYKYEILEELNYHMFSDINNIICKYIAPQIIHTLVPQFKSYIQEERLSSIPGTDDYNIRYFVYRQ